MNYIEIKFSPLSKQQSEILLAMLANIGFEGFEENENELFAFIKETDFNKEELDAIVVNQNIKYSLKTIEQQNWNAQWEQSFEPVIVDDFVAVRANFHPPVKNVEHEIVITPKMSFGTGHHPTTFLMLQQMRKLNFKNKSVLDFGTGTGVLAILAQKLGATSITAIDNDEWSIENAKENISTNNADAINIYAADAINQKAKFDIILANINLNVIKENMQQIASCATTDAKIILSGFLVADEDEIKKCMQENGLKFNYTAEKNGWLCISAFN